MDALLFLNTDSPHVPAANLRTVLQRARRAQGVVVFGFAPTAEAPEESRDESPTDLVPDAEDLVLEASVPDIFEGVDELAQGLDDLKVDRLVIGGVDTEGALDATVTAAVTLGFDVVLIGDAAVDASGQPVAWMDEVAYLGVVVKPAADTWLRM